MSVVGTEDTPHDFFVFLVVQPGEQHIVQHFPSCRIMFDIRVGRGSVPESFGQIEQLANGVPDLDASVRVDLATGDHKAVHVLELTLPGDRVNSLAPDCSRR